MNGNVVSDNLFGKSANHDEKNFTGIQPTWPEMIYSTAEREAIGLCICLKAVGDIANHALLTLRDVSAYPGESNEENFPDEYRKDWAWIMKQLTKSGPVLDHKGEVWRGSVENTISKIKNTTGAKIAEKIFDIGWEVHTNEKYFDNTLPIRKTQSGCRECRDAGVSRLTQSPRSKT